MLSGYTDRGPANGMPLSRLFTVAFLMALCLFRDSYQSMMTYTRGLPADVREPSDPVLPREQRSAKILPCCRAD